MSPSNQVLENEFGIDLTKSYSGLEVNELLNIVAQEADVAIERAYAEGYKSAMLELSPKMALLESMEDYYKTELERLRKDAVPKWQIPLWTIGGAAVGFGISSIYFSLK